VRGIRSVYPGGFVGIRIEGEAINRIYQGVDEGVDGLS
jgi:hypothetical protein